MPQEWICSKCGGSFKVDSAVSPLKKNQPSLSPLCPRCAQVEPAQLQSDSSSSATSEDVNTIVVPASEQQQVMERPLAPTDDIGSIEAELGGRAFGDYEIIEEIARGGMGIVYKARQISLDRIVAIKVLQRGPSSTRDLVQRFLREAQSAAKLQHPNIVPIHEVGVQNGRHYFTMDFIEGESVADMLDRGPVQPRRALEIVKQVAEALRYAHEQGVVHRDIKPGNILLDRHGFVKITDFGLAKQLTAEDMSLTMTGQVVGTPRYMSPEQASGRKSGNVDHRTDIYSLGITLYEMLTHQPAFDGETVITVLQQVATKEPPPPRKIQPRIHRDVETICLKSIEKDPRRRYQRAAELMEDARRFLDGEPILSRPPNPIYRLWRRFRPVAPVVFTSLSVAVALVWIYVFYWFSQPAYLSFEDIQPPNATISVDGKQLAKNELGRVELKRGAHTIVVDGGPKFAKETYNLKLAPKQITKLSPRLTPRTGLISVATEPADAAVIISDGGEILESLRAPVANRDLLIGDYRIRAEKTNYIPQERQLSLIEGDAPLLKFNLRPMTQWTFPTGGPVLSIPAVIYIKDAAETQSYVVVGCDDGRIYCLSTSDGTVRWVFAARDAVQAPIATGDMNGDGIADVVVGSRDQTMYCLSGVDGRVIWTFAANAAITSPALLKDVNGDGVPDTFFGASDGTFHALSGKDGRKFWSFAGNGAIDQCVAFADVNGDGKEKILFGTAGGTLFCLEPHDGREIWREDFQDTRLWFPLLLADVTGDGKKEILVSVPQYPGDGRTRIALSLPERTRLWRSSDYSIWVDLDGDGKAERLLLEGNRLKCIESDGENLRWESPYANPMIYSGDVNNDGVADLTLIHPPNNIVCISGRNGSSLGTVVVEGGVGRGLTLDDVDRDGTLDVLVGSTSNKIACFSWNGGRKQWAVRSAGFFDQSPALVAIEDTVLAIVKDSNGDVLGLRADNGEVLWRHPTGPQADHYSSLAVFRHPDKSHWIVTPNTTRRSMDCVSANDGKLKWQRVIEGSKDVALGTPVVVDADNEMNPFVLFGDGEKNLIALNAKDSELLWTAPVPDLSLPVRIGTNKDASRFIIAAGGDKTLRCLDLKTRQELWTLQNENGKWGEPFILTSSTANETEVLVASSDGNLYCLSAQTGKARWHYEYSSQPLSHVRLPFTVVVTDNDYQIICASPEGRLFLVSSDGKELSRVEIGDPVFAAPVVIPSAFGYPTPTVLVSTMGRKLRCLTFAPNAPPAELWSHGLGAPSRFASPALFKSLTSMPMVIAPSGPPENTVWGFSGTFGSLTPRKWSGPWPTQR